MFSENNQWYCWWKKSCTTWHVWSPINGGKNYLVAGAGFLPSTVPNNQDNITTCSCQKVCYKEAGRGTTTTARTAKKPPPPPPPPPPPTATTTTTTTTTTTLLGRLCDLAPFLQKTILWFVRFSNPNGRFDFVFRLKQQCTQRLSGEVSSIYIGRMAKSGARLSASTGLASLGDHDPWSAKHCQVDGEIFRQKPEKHVKMWRDPLRWGAKTRSCLNMNFFLTEPAFIKIGKSSW